MYFHHVGFDEDLFPKSATVFATVVEMLVLVAIDQSIIWSFLHPVVTNWSIMAVRAQMDQTKQPKMIFEYIFVT